MLRVELITTGEELLSGQITDTNATWISVLLGENGLMVGRRTTIGDRIESLVACFQERSAHADVIIVNGGLGPTSDDLSAQAAALALGEEVVLFNDWVEVLQKRFVKLGREMSPANLKQATLPRSAEILDNPVGTACGFVIRLNGCLLYFTPGVPSEMKPMMKNVILPHLRSRLEITFRAVLKRLHCMGMAEAHLGALLETIELPEGIHFGFRAKRPTVEIKIMGLGRDMAVLGKQIEVVAVKVRELLGDIIVFEDDHTLATAIQELMISAGGTLSLAESCTGGLIASMLVAVPGSSAYLDRAAVTYSNQAKSDMLGVDLALIEAKGAVSLEVAREMARGIRRRSGTSHSLAVSGVAGPGGGTPDKPVGTVAFALDCPEGTFSLMVQGPPWGRDAIRTASAGLALDMLRRQLTRHQVFPNYDFTKIVAKEFQKAEPSR